MRKSLKTLSIDDMLSEIKRRNRLIAKLNKKRSILLVKVAEVEEQIRVNGGEIKRVGLRAAGIGKRPRNAQSLPDAMADVMNKEKPMSVAQIEEAVTKKGYRSTSSTFKTIIFQALAKDKRFKKVSRGQYALR
jgi:hypothetical protein